MKAVQIYTYGHSDVLKYEDAPVPEIGPDEVLVKVHACGVNPVDWKIREGFMARMVNYTMPLILGWDVSGVVEKTGPLVRRFKSGDNVFCRPATSRNGAYAEYVAVRSFELAHAPKSIPLYQAAGFPLASQAAWMALFEVGGLKQDQSVLIHGGSGGVGSFAIQLAKIAGAGRIVTTTSGRNSAMVKSWELMKSSTIRKRISVKNCITLTWCSTHWGEKPRLNHSTCSEKEVPLFHQLVLMKKQHQLTGFWENPSCSIQTERDCRR